MRPVLPVLDDAELFRDLAYVDGAWISAASGKVFEVKNPADGKTLGTVPDMDDGDARRAIHAAQRAQGSWAATAAHERGKILRRLASLMTEHIEDLALLMTLEEGKPLDESRGEISYAASFIDWFAEEARRVYGEIIPPHQTDKRVLVLRQPVGVVGAITPWNFPAAMITRKAGPALAAGCTFIVKPASATPYSALALAELAGRAGVPRGVFNVITGSADKIGRELTTNPLVRKFTFTGSTAVGRQLLAQCAGTIKRISMELGGNAPFIVFDDADMDAAVEGAIASKFRNMGQTCVCANRFYVQQGIYNSFARKLQAAVEKLKVGPGTTTGIDQGPLINEDAVCKVEDHIRDALAKGAKLLTGSGRHSLGGTYFEPTVLTDASQEMKFTREETFGPVAALIPFARDDDAIRMANESEYGLAAYFYARDIGRLWNAAEKIEAGMIGINTGLLSTSIAPFGGIKQSGIGREGARHGIDEYVEMKYLCLGDMPA
jgi:succinate-semialdehyde dehydrogenase/glutarate-semialdehyde dehydrogenase